MTTKRPDRITGPELRRTRLAMDVSQASIGRRMGVPQARVWTIEATAFPTHDAARRYTEALDAEIRARADKATRP